MSPQHSARETPHASLIIGNAAESYQFVPGWGTLPDGQVIGPTHGGVAVDPLTGFVYVSTTSKHSVLVYQADGRFMKTIAPECSGFHALDFSARDGQSALYGAQLKGAHSRICKLDTDGNLVLEISAKSNPDLAGGWGGLTSVAVAPDGTIFCSMGYGSNLIHKFSPSGEHLLSFGGKGAGDAVRTKTSHGLKVDTRFEPARLLVCDRENRRIFHTSLDGVWIGEVASNLRRPCAISIYKDMCAIAELEGRVTLLDKQGAIIAHLGDNPDKTQRAKFKVSPNSIKDSVFTAPHGLSFDVEGNLYVQDWNKYGRVSKLIRMPQSKSL
jgi:DNA-binding beta-propeller fold protein YncE